MKKQLISSALAFCAFAMILPGAVFAQENLAAAPACTQNEGCQATQGFQNGNNSLQFVSSKMKSFG